MWYRLVLLGLMVCSISGCIRHPSVKKSEPLPFYAQLGLDDVTWHALDADAQESWIAYAHWKKEKKPKPKTIYKGPILRIRVQTGLAHMPGLDSAHQAIRPVSFCIRPGSCRSIRLNSTNTKKHFVMMPVCYDGLSLMMDPQHYTFSQKFNAIRFDVSPVWTHGFLFEHIHTLGRVHLYDASVHIRVVSSCAP